MTRRITPGSPLASSTSTSPPTGKDAPPKQRILIAEDSESTRLQLQELLQGELEVQVDTVGDGAQALKELLEQNYSIILTDLNMPGGGGMDLITTQ
jgi:CheY-like chemotaxis protein